MHLVITDNLAEMIEIGKRIVEEKTNIYTPMMLNTIKEVVKSYNSGGDYLTKIYCINRFTITGHMVILAMKSFTMTLFIKIIIKKKNI